MNLTLQFSLFLGGLDYITQIWSTVVNIEGFGMLASRIPSGMLAFENTLLLPWLVSQSHKHKQVFLRIHQSTFLVPTTCAIVCQPNHPTRKTVMDDRIMPQDATFAASCHCAIDVSAPPDTIPDHHPHRLDQRR